MFDRLIGLVALITITGHSHRIALSIYSRKRPRPTLHLRSASGDSRSVVAGELLRPASSSAVSILFHLLPHKIPGREKLIEISAAYHLYARHWFATLCRICASLVAHLATFVTFLCVAYAFRRRRRLIDFFADHADRAHHCRRCRSVSPASAARTDSASDACTNSAASSDGVAKLIGSMSFLVMLLCCAPGGIVYFFYRPSGATGHVKLREMEQRSRNARA